MLNFQCATLPDGLLRACLDACRARDDEFIDIEEYIVESMNDGDFIISARFEIYGVMHYIPCILGIFIARRCVQSNVEDILMWNTNAIPCALLDEIYILGKSKEFRKKYKSLPSGLIKSCLTEFTNIADAIWSGDFDWRSRSRRIPVQPNMMKHINSGWVHRFLMELDYMIEFMPQAEVDESIVLLRFTQSMMVWWRSVPLMMTSPLNIGNQ